MQSNQEIDPYPPSRTKKTMLQIYNDLKNDLDLYNDTCEREYLEHIEQSYRRYKAQFHHFQDYMKLITNYVKDEIMKTNKFYLLSSRFKQNLLRHISNASFRHYYNIVHQAARSYGHSNNSTHGATTNEAIKAQEAINDFNDLINNYNYGDQDFTY